MNTSVLANLQSRMPQAPSNFKYSVHECALEAKKSLESLHSASPEGAMLTLVHQMEELEARLKASSTPDWWMIRRVTPLLARTALMTSKTWTVGNHTARMDALANGLLSAKNADYGHAYAKYGVEGMIIRIWDKILRWINLQDKETKVESLEDTSLDMAGYFLLMYAFAAGKIYEAQHRATPKGTATIKQTTWVTGDKFPTTVKIPFFCFNGTVPCL